jgi:hypothetical protein
MSAVEPQAQGSAEPAGSALFRQMPLLELMLAFDTRWRAFRSIHRRSEDVAELHELYRPIMQEVHRLGMVELFTGRGAFKGDAKEAFERCLDLARGSGLAWPDIVEVVNRSGEAGR